MIKLMVKRYWEVMFVQSDLVNLDGSLDHLPRFVFFLDIYIYIYIYIYSFDKNSCIIYMVQRVIYSLRPILCF